MGHRYQARVTFPRAALGIVDIRRAVDAFIQAENSPGNYSREHWEDEDADTITLQHDEANYGRIYCGDATIDEVLDGHSVPYDWYHSEGEGSDCPFDVHVRWVDGERVEIETNEATVAELFLARRIKDSLETIPFGYVFEIHNIVDPIIARAPVALEDLDWQP